jgi:hypothetical protein
MAFGRCRLVLRTYAVVFPYPCLWGKTKFSLNSNWHPDGIATSSGRIHWCTWTLDSSGILKSVWMDASLNSSKLLDTDGSPDEITTSSGWMLLDWWASGRLTGTSWRMHGIWLLWVGIYTESSLNTWNSLLEACDDPFFFFYTKRKTSHRSGTTMCRSANIWHIPITCTRSLELCLTTEYNNQCAAEHIS